MRTTCDMCSAVGECQTVDDCDVCADCLAFHERAVSAAADAGWSDLSSTVQDYYDDRRDRWRRTVAEIVKVYCEYGEAGE